MFFWRTLGSEGFRDLPAHLRGADPFLLLLAAALNLGRYALWTSRWRGVTAAVSRVDWWPSFRALMGSVFLNTVVPGARPLGGIVRARILSRTSGVAPGPVYAATLVDQLGYSLVSVTVGLISLPRALMPAEAGGRLPLLLGSVVLGALLVVLVYPKGRAWLRSRLGRHLSRAATTVKGAVQAVPRVLARPATWAWVILCGPPVWYANAITIWMAGKAVGASFGMADAAAAWALGSLVGAATGIPGGIGVTEAFGSAALIEMGVPPGQALAAVLLGRALHYLSATLIGAPFLFKYGRGGRQEGALA